MRPFLKEWREFKGYTQAGAGEKLGQSDATIARWESGKREPGVDDLIKLAQLYGCRPQDLWAPPDEPIGPALDAGLLQRVVTMAARKMAGMAGAFRPEDFAGAILAGYDDASRENTRERQRAVIEKALNRSASPARPLREKKRTASRA